MEKTPSPYGGRDLGVGRRGATLGFLVLAVGNSPMEWVPKAARSPLAQPSSFYLLHFQNLPVTASWPFISANPLLDQSPFFYQLFFSRGISRPIQINDKNRAQGKILRKFHNSGVDSDIISPARSDPRRAPHDRDFLFRFSLPISHRSSSVDEAIQAREV